MIKKLFTKLFCCHDWKILHVTSYKDCNAVLLTCSKCGRLKKKII